MNSRRFLISPFKTDLSHNTESSLKVGIIARPFSLTVLAQNTTSLCWNPSAGYLDVAC